MKKETDAHVMLFSFIVYFIILNLGNTNVDSCITTCKLIGSYSHVYLPFNVVLVGLGQDESLEDSNYLFIS